MAETSLGLNPGAGKGSVQDEFSLPDDCYVVRFSFSTSSRQSADVHRMIIWFAGTPGSDSDFNNADAGSLFIDTTNNDTYVFDGTSTWTQT